MSLLDSLPTRCGAARQAQSMWNALRFTQQDTQKIFDSRYAEGVDLRSELLHHERFAFRHDSHLSGRVQAIAEGNNQADTIQDLSDLAVLGRENLHLLQAINIDEAQLNQAATCSEDLAKLGATAHGDTAEAKEIKKLRDKSYSYLNMAVTEIRACGRYAFWKEPDRRSGYRSNFLRRNRKSTKTSPADLQPS